MSILRSHWILTSAAGAIAFATGMPALAQSGSAAAPQAAENRLDDIVVTARRREESQQSVPIAVTALSPERLAQAQITTARELTGLVPSLTVGSGNQRDYNRYTIRGQGVTAGANEGVTVYFAEAPLNQFVGGGPGLYHDLQNVQVLNGPQGTLFGRNTTGGAVLLTPHKPEFSNSGRAEFGYGNYNNLEFGGVINLSVVPDKLAIRLSGERRMRDGFTKQADNTELDDINYTTLRFGMVLNLSDSFENYTIAQYTRSSTGGTGMFVKYLRPGGVYTATVTPYLAQLEALNKKRTVTTDDHFWRTRSLVIVNTSTINLSDELTFKNIVSYARSRIAGGFDLDGTPIVTSGYRNNPLAGNPSQAGEGRNRYVSEEAQVQGNMADGNLNWVLGGFYQDGRPYGPERNITLSGTGGTTYQEGAVKASTRAVFAQGTYNFGAMSDSLKDLRLTLGARYTWDKRQFSIAQYREAFAPSPPAPPNSRACTTITGNFFPNCTRTLGAKFSAPTYTVTLDYQATDRTLVYATVRRGYKSGGLNVVSSPSVPDNFGPEKVDDIEVGVKSDFDIGAMPVRTNLALFRDKYSNIQRTAYSLDPTTNLATTFISNASKGTIKGLELSVLAKPTDSLELNVAYSYLDAKYTDFPFKDAALPAPVLPALYNSNLRGVQLPYSPKNQISASLTWTLPIPEDMGKLSVNGRIRYQDKYRATDQNQPGNILGDYHLINLGLNWTGIGGSPLDAELYVTNLANRRDPAIAGIFYYSIGYVSESYLEPRMFGMRLKYNFGE